MSVILEDFLAASMVASWLSHIHFQAHLLGVHCESRRGLNKLPGSTDYTLKKDVVRDNINLFSYNLICKN